MSEYQYYEFQAIDRPLTEEEQQAVAQLSSRVEPHPWRAVFVYNYGDFHGDPEKVLARYYDAMLYITNWGSRRLMFRFPRSILDLEEVRAYCRPPIVEDYISCSTVGEYIILNVEFRDETGGGWVEGEGWLPAMIGLRDDILRGDYRALYLAWLKTPEVEALRDSVVEPPVPPGLSRLSPSLRSFVEFFGIDECLVQVAAETSSNRKAASDDWLQEAIARLPREECDVFLLRLARGEPLLSVELSRRLGEIAPVLEPEQRPRRTVGQLLKKAEERWEREQRRQAEEAEARRIRELEALAQRQAQTWREIEILIHRSQSKAYQEVAELLVKLREVAVYQSQEVAFQERLNSIYERYKNRHSLLSRLREAGLRQQ
jgi:hypothetical protein